MCCVPSSIKLWLICEKLTFDQSHRQDVASAVVTVRRRDVIPGGRRFEGGDADIKGSQRATLNNILNEYKRDRIETIREGKSVIDMLNNERRGGLKFQAGVRRVATLKRATSDLQASPSLSDYLHNKSKLDTLSQKED